MKIRLVPAMAFAFFACLATAVQAQNIEWPTSLAPHPFAILFAKGNYWVTSYDFSNPDAIGTIVAVNSQDGSVGAGPFSTGGRNPSGLAFDGAHIWVGHHDDLMGQAVVSKLDAATGQLLLAVGGFEHVTGLVFDSSTGSIWVNDQGANTVTKLRASDGAVSLKADNGFSAPMGNLFDGTNVWIANSGSGTVTKMDANGKILGTFVTGSGPAFMAADADGNIWVTNYNDDTVTKLSANDGSILGTFPTGASPVGVTFDGVNILIANSGEGTVTKLNPADGASRGTIATAGDPRFIAADTSGNLWVTSASANQITAFQQINPCAGGAFAVSGTNATCTYGPGSYNFVVPPDVFEEAVHVYGAQGGHAGPDQQGGLGAYVGAVTSVTPGYALVISVGGQGGPGARLGDACLYCAGGTGGAGGYGGGAPGGDGGRHSSSGQQGFAGGGGGGRSQVDFYANGEGHLYAGGGGGGGGTGGDNYCSTVFGITTCKRFPGGPGGAAGGATGASGGVGHYFDGVTGIGGGGGGGGSVSAGGGGGRGHYVVEPRGPEGGAGSFLTGGSGSGGGFGAGCISCNGNSFGGGGGGGGGGGYYGGGGGAGGIGTNTLNDSGGGGGGGGGSSFWTGPGVLSATFSAGANSGHGVVVVSWSLRAQAIYFTSTAPSPAQAPGSYVVSATGGSSGNPVVFSTSTPGVCTVSGSTVSFTVAGTCTIAANQDGNGGYLAADQVQQSFSIVQDSTSPVITPTVTGTHGNNGWYTSNVQVSWSVTDPESAISSSWGCGNTTVSSDTAGTTFTCTATSAGGNASQSVTVKRDATAPVVTAAADRPADRNGWYNHALTVRFTATDAVSGIAACDAAQTYSGPDGVTNTASGGCSDQAGNTSSGTLSFQYDATAPAVTATATRPADHNGWYNHALAVNFTGTDSASGIAGCDASKGYAGPDTTTTTVSGSCTDQAGNTSAGALTFKYDATAAAVTYSGNAGSYTVDQAVNITCASADNLSGVASSTCQNITGPAYTFNAGANSFSATATDHAGNTGSGSALFSIQVTTSSMCGLVKQFVANHGIANALCVKLDGKAGQLGAFKNQVAAQSGKALTPAQAALLTRLAGEL